MIRGHAASNGSFTGNSDATVGETIMSFVVTGLGRSGTKFLATMLARGDHDVTHEVPSDRRLRPKRRRDAFNARVRGNYGEVNSRLREVLLELDVDHRFVIIRHPFDLVRSTMIWNRGRRDETIRPLGESIVVVERGLRTIDKLIVGGVPFIRFEQMIHDPLIINMLANDLGIHLHAFVRPYDLTRPINASRRGVSVEIPLLPQLQWFVEQYYPFAQYPNGCGQCRL